MYAADHICLQGIIFVCRELYLFAGVHSVDFSGVRDDKCHTGVGQSRVSFKQDIFKPNFAFATIHIKIGPNLSFSIFQYSK